MKNAFGKENLRIMTTTFQINEIDSWPEAVRSYILDRYGSITSVEVLSGLSRNIVRKVNTASKRGAGRKSWVLSF